MDSPKSFDWVQARRKCSLQEVFLLLAEVVDSDVKAISSGAEPSLKFSMHQPTGNKIIVSRVRDLGGIYDRAELVTFELSTYTLDVKANLANEEQQLLFKAKPTLMPSGECKLEIDGHKDPMELWQVSRMGLEKLFFKD